ncbi:MAG: hypothetical protein ACI923_001044 [Flavobacteriales bacterium]|jgi:hypothetical protein
MRLTLYILVFLMSVATSPTWAQLDTTLRAKTQVAPSKAVQSTLKLKPRLGLGIGSLVFYGDMGGDNKGYNPGSADMVYTLDITNEFTSFLDVRLYTIFGKININETTNPRHLNMQSTIRTGGIAFSYNFNNFFQSKQVVKPYISAGFEAFEYLSKTDMYDSEGRRYFYWSDGSIRDMDQHSTDAGNSILLNRDYTYETDLRELNGEGLGRFPERAFAIPIGAGIEFEMTERVKARLGMTYHFTLTDKVDHITSAGEGVRQGDSKNDRFLFTSFSLNYDLNPIGLKKPNEFEELFDENGELLAGVEDTDGDLIPDVIDKCHGTPPNVPVDEFGCPLDSDNDGFPDYRDLEPNSPHTYVNGEGIAMNDDAIYDRYLMWNDSTPWTTEGTLNELYAQSTSDLSKSRSAYRIRIPRSQSNLTQEEINSLLALQDILMVNENGEDVFVVGNFDEIPDAIRRKIELSRMGIDGSLVAANANDEMTPVEDDPGLEADIMAAMDLEEDVLGIDSEVHFRVQVGAFRYSLSRNIFSGENDIWAISGNDGLKRYITSSYLSVEEAAKRRVDLLESGFEGAFITAYSGGNRITLSDAGLNVIDASKDLLVDTENQSINTERIMYKIHLGTFQGDVPTELLDKLLSFGNVKPIVQKDGITSFMSVPCKTIEQAEEMLQIAKNLGIENSEIIGDFDGEMIPLEDVKNLKN